MHKLGRVYESYPMSVQEGSRGRSRLKLHMSYSLNSLKGGCIGEYYRDDYKGDTRSLDMPGLHDLSVETLNNFSWYLHGQARRA